MIPLENWGQYPKRSRLTKRWSKSCGDAAKYRLMLRTFLDPWIWKAATASVVPWSYSALLWNGLVDLSLVEHPLIGWVPLVCGGNHKILSFLFSRFTKLPLTCGFCWCDARKESVERERGQHTSLEVIALRLRSLDCLNFGCRWGKTSWAEATALISSSLSWKFDFRI